jgi:hypothetical protein
MSIVHIMTQDLEPKDDDDVVFISEQQVHELQTTKSESQDSLFETTNHPTTLVDRIVLLDEDNTSLLAAHAARLASVHTKLEDAEREASKYKRNATEANNESDGLCDKLTYQKPSGLFKSFKQKSPKTKLWLKSSRASSVGCKT